ncbi:MAG TPA: nucleotidyl transferase AbiEii/AbiGii toxin family protein [Pyrinomonadaceae bacterium]|nr:nucleotidyl transferase AbiEii/AbiGii toxin family protein [Pyrinomonadaceae bacterium]
MPQVDPPKDILLVLSALTDWFRDQNVSYAIIGGVAIGLIAQPRETQDIDAVAWIDLVDLPVLLKSAAEFGFVSRLSDPQSFAENTRMMLLTHTASGLSVDVSCGALPFEREMIDRSTKFKIHELVLRVATPEDLLITKAVAHRGKDLIDIENLLTVYPDLDLARVRNWVKQFADILEMPELLTDLDQRLKGSK